MAMKHTKMMGEDYTKAATEGAPRNSAYLKHYF